MRLLLLSPVGSRFPPDLIYVRVNHLLQLGVRAAPLRSTVVGTSVLLYDATSPIFAESMVPKVIGAHTVSTRSASGRGTGRGDGAALTKRGYGAARRLPRLAPFESRGLAKHATKAPRPVPHELLHLEVDELDAVLAEDGARGLDVAQQPSPEDLRPHLVRVRVRVRLGLG